MGLRSRVYDITILVFNLSMCNGSIHEKIGTTVEKVDRMLRRDRWKMRGLLTDLGTSSVNVDDRESGLRTRNVVEIKRLIVVCNWQEAYQMRLQV